MSPSSTPTPAPAPNPTADSGDPLSTVVGIVARPEVLELRNAAGAIVASLDYLGDPLDAEIALEAVFGAPAESETYPGNSHNPGGMVHRWGGLELWQPQYEGELAGMPRSYYQPSFFVHFTAATSGEVELATEDARQVGDPWSELLAASGLQTNLSGCSGPYLDFVEIAKTDIDGREYAQRVAVVFRASEGDVTIARIAAPVEIHDECA